MAVSYTTSADATCSWWRWSSWPPTRWRPASGTRTAYSPCSDGMADGSQGAEEVTGLVAEHFAAYL